MTILVTGANGLVGSHFAENYSGDLKKEKITILSPAIDKLNITDEKSVRHFFDLYKPDTIIHFAAFTDVTLAEKERGSKDGIVWRVNVLGTANLINECNRRLHYKSKPVYFIYISTDGVFSGLKNNPGPYPEDYPTEKNPNYLSWYGWTKKEGEELVLTELKNAAIIRIANPVRAQYKDKLDYVRKILWLYDQKALYPMFADQYLTLTYINEVTESLKVLLEKKLPGIYHVSSLNTFTPFKLANLLLEKTRNQSNLVKPVSIKDFLIDNPSRYPQYGGLKVEKTKKILGLNFMKWEEIIFSLAKQLRV